MQDPVVLDVLIPRQDMTFEAWEEAYTFYYDYANLAGFDVRKYRTMT